MEWIASSVSLVDNYVENHSDNQSNNYISFLSRFLSTIILIWLQSDTLLSIFIKKHVAMMGNILQGRMWINFTFFLIIYIYVKLWPKEQLFSARIRQMLHVPKIT